MHRTGKVKEDQRKKLINRNLKSNSGGTLGNHVSNDSKRGDGSVAKSCPTLVTPWTVARQAPLSMGFSRQDYWSGWPFPSPGIFPTQGSNPGLLLCRLILYQRATREAPIINISRLNLPIKRQKLSD